MKIGSEIILEIDWSTEQTATSDSSEWNKGDRLVLANIENYGWKYIRTAEIRE